MIEYVLFDLHAFLFLLLPSGVGVVEDDVVDLLPIVLLLHVDLLVEAVELLFQFLDGDFLQLNLALQLLVFCQELLVLASELFLLLFELVYLLFQTAVFVVAVRLRLFYLVQQVLIPSYQFLSGFLHFSESGLQGSHFECVSLRLLLLQAISNLSLFLEVLQTNAFPLVQPFFDFVIDLVAVVFHRPDLFLQCPESVFPISCDFLHLDVVLLLHAFLNLQVLLFQLLEFLVGLSQFFVVLPHVQVLVPLHLLMFGSGPVQLEFDVPILDHQLVALVLQVLQFPRVHLLPLYQILQLLFQPDLQLGGVLPVLVQDIFQVPHHVLFRKVVNGIHFAQVHWVYVGSLTVLSLIDKGAASYHQLVFGNWISASVGLQNGLQGVDALLLYLLAGQLHIKQTLVVGSLEFCSEVVDVRRVELIVPELKKFECLGACQVGHDAFEGLTRDFVIRDIESFYFETGLNQASEVIFPAIVLLISQVVVLNDQLPKARVSAQCFEDMFESLSRDIVAFYLQYLDFSVVGDELCKFLGALISDETVVEDKPGVVAEILKLGSQGHNLNCALQLISVIGQG